MRRAALALFFAPVACDLPAAPIDPAAHLATVEAWRAKRYETLRQPTGWLSLVGLFWLADTTYTFGSDPASDFSYTSPSAGFPEFAGTFRLHSDSVHFEAAPGARVTHNGEPVTSILLAPDTANVALDAGPVRWTVIRRSGRYAIRAWDAESLVRTTFTGIDAWPVDVRWSLPARFHVKDPPDTIDILNVLGDMNRTPSPAWVSFEIDGETVTLDLWKDSDDPVNFFTAFADRTNGSGSYGGGRYLWIDAPDERGRTVVDFNRAYNPPCVFTEFATCPLPPPQNRMDATIAAGEKAWSSK